MTATACATAILCCLVGAEPAPSEASEMETHARWRRIFDDVAAEYRLRREAEAEPLELLDRRTYNWARSGPNGGNFGTVYVWTHRGTVDAVACFWRYVAADGKPDIVHELHSLSPVVLESEGEAARSWKPKAGVKRQLITGAPAPAKTAAGRMQQMRALCRDFSAHTVGEADDRTEMRLLPQPLYRYESTDPGVLDGGLFAFVCDVGTDPEAFLQLEAVNTADGPRWQYTLARFTHMDLFVSYKDREVWTALRDEDNPISHNADHTYWVFGQPFDPSLLKAAGEVE